MLHNNMKDSIINTVTVVITPHYCYQFLSAAYARAYYHILARQGISCQVYQDWSRYVHR